MAHDTQSINKLRQNLDDFDEIWLFGYGSLIHKVDFDFIQSQRAYIEGFERRFWQGSHDHRGTPDNPGRVLTLIPVENSRCFGIAFQVTQDVFEHLDHREKNGYLREEIVISLEDGGVVTGLVYIANPDNAAFLGDAPLEKIAAHIHKSKGPSGTNRDYLFHLADALRDHQEHDGHVFELERLVRELI